MTDTMTQERLLVSTGGKVGPYIRLPLSQLEGVKRLLDQHHVRHWVREHAIAWDGAPYVAVIKLGREGEAEAVQAILDSAS